MLYTAISFTTNKAWRDEAKFEHRKMAVTRFSLSRRGLGPNFNARLVFRITINRLFVASDTTREFFYSAGRRPALSSNAHCSKFPSRGETVVRPLASYRIAFHLTHFIWQVGRKFKKFLDPYPLGNVLVTPSPPPREGGGKFCFSAYFIR